MKKIVKTLAWTFISLLIILGLAFATVTIFINPNKIKPYLTKIVAEETGHELSIDGDLKWTFYPLLGVSAEHVILKNKVGFPNEPFVNANKIIVSVQLKPLFSKQINIDEIFLQDAQINLTKLNSTQNNWTFEKSSKPKNETTETSKPDEYSIDISKIIVQNANIKYNNIPDHKTTTIKKLNLSTKNIQPEKPFNLNTDFFYDNSHYVFEGSVRFNAADEILVLKNYQLKIQGKKETTISGEVELNLKSELLSLKPFSIQLPGFKAIGNLKGTNIFKQAHFQGHIETNSFSPKKIAESLGYPLHTASHDALSSAKFSANISTDTNAIQLENLRGNLDKTQLNGTVKWNLSTKLLNFTLNGDQLSLDNYKMSNASSKKAENNLTNHNKSSSFKANGKLSFNSLMADKVRLDRFSTNLSYENDILNLTNMVGGIFGGTTSGSASISTKTKDAVIQINQRLSGINISAAEKLLVGESKLSGTANATANLRLQGDLSNLNGNLNFASQNGEIKGVDLDYQIQRAASMIQRTETSTKDRGKTPYSTLSSVATIKNGVIHNSQVLLESPTFKVTAEGSTNLLSKAINYNLQLKSKKSVDINTDILRMDLSDYEIPVRITGTFDDFNVQLNVVELTKIAAKKQLLKQIQKATERPLNETIDAIKKALPF